MYLLHKRKITLLDPASWDNKNDSHYLTQYKEKRKLKSVLALCLMQSDERYHHWSVFAPGPSGVCVRFKRDELLRNAGVAGNISARILVPHMDKHRTESTLGGFV